MGRGTPYLRHIPDCARPLTVSTLKQKLSILFIPLTILVCIGIVFMPLACEAKTKSKKKAAAPYSPPYAHLILDADTGIVISQENADKALYPASLTKLMTLLLTFEALDARRITLSSPVPMTSHAASMPPSKIGLRPGQSLSVENAIKALVTKSANDVAVALGEKLGGSEGQFAQMMTLRARQIGMSQTKFINASGLHNSKQTSSARDMAKLALYILTHYPHYYSYFSLRNFYFNGHSYHSHNRLMESYRGMDGMKTGYIAPSGFNLVASAKRGNVRLVGVVFGGKTANSRNARMADLLDEGFAKIGQLRIMNAKAPQMKKGPEGVSPPLPSAKPTLLATPSTPPLPSAPAATSLPMTTRVSSTPVPTPPPAPILKTSPAPQTNYAALPPTTLSPAPVSAPSPAGWSIQIGAFQDRVSTDQAIYKALQKLPTPLNRGNALIVPLRTADATWMFRARIGGYTKEQAMLACRYLEDCLTISPSAN